MSDDILLKLDAVAVLLDEMSCYQAEKDCIKAKEEITALREQLAGCEAMMNYYIAKKAVEYFDREFIGQEPGRLWKQAIAHAIKEPAHED